MRTKNKDKTSARVRTGMRLAAFLPLVLSFLFTTEMLAQETNFGVAPSERTRQALSDPPTRSTREQPGLYASVGIAYTRRTNVRRETVEGQGVQPSEPESDSAIVITPQAGYKRYFGRHRGEVNVTTQFARYKDLTEENTENYTVKALTNLDLTRILDLDLFASFSDASEPRGGSGTRVDQSLEPDEVEVIRYGGAFTVGRRQARLQLRGGADRSQFRYQNNRQEFRDRDDDRVFGRVYYNISPRTSVFAGLSLTDVTYQQRADNLDSEQLTYEVGGRWDITAETIGSVSVGQTEKDFDDPVRNDTDATTLAGRLSWSPRPRTTFNLYGSRQFEETTSINDDFYISELVGASVRQAIGSRWHASTYINVTNDEFETNREDEYLDYGVGLEYAFRNWLSMGAQYSIVERDSNIPANDYEDEILSLYLKGNFTRR